jgi:hypothetical protein
LLAFLLFLKFYLIDTLPVLSVDVGVPIVAFAPAVASIPAVADIFCCCCWHLLLLALALAGVHALAGILGSCFPAVASITSDPGTPTLAGIL